MQYFTRFTFFFSGVSAKFTQRLGLNLTDAFSGYVEFFAYFIK